MFSSNRACYSVGYPQYELVEGGSELIVDSHNVGEYIDAVVNATLHEGIAAQMQGFRYATAGPVSYGICCKSLCTRGSVSDSPPMTSLGKP